MNLSRIFILFISVAFFACSNADNGKPVNESALFGWKKESTEALRVQCLERYDAKKNNGVDKTEYCNCFVGKIIVSVKHQDFVDNKENAVTTVDNLSKTCAGLSDKGEQIDEYKSPS